LTKKNEDGFCVKDLIERMDKITENMNAQYENDRERHDLIMKEISSLGSKVSATNGKVKMHTKLIWGIGGTLFTLVLFAMEKII